MTSVNTMTTELPQDSNQGTTMRGTILELFSLFDRVTASSMMHSVSELAQGYSRAESQLVHHSIAQLSQNSSPVLESASG